MKSNGRTEHPVKTLPCVLVAMTLMTAGCASTDVAEQETTSQRPLNDPIYTVGCSTTVQPEHRVELDLIDSLMSDREYYAALAQLESLSFDTQHHWLRWAQLLAQVEQVEDSADAFRAIAATCDSYESYHGLGVVYVKQGKITDAIDVLARAKDMSPAVPEIRNDYGYALMVGGHYGRAAFELRTAYELSKGKAAVRQNMIAAYYLNGGEAALNDLKKAVRLKEADVSAGKQVAKNILGGRP
ncbi:MAG: tetratricopeptide repeat protein [Pseudomonadota bacterium]